MEFANRIAVITGASGRLGHVVVRQLGKMGLRLVLVGTNQEKLEALGQEMKLPEEQILPVVVNLVDPESARELFNRVIDRFGGADLLLHFVGGWIAGKPIAQVSDEDVTIMLQQHGWSTFYLVRAFTPHMVAKGWGRVIVISSPSASTTPAKGLPYTIGKSVQEAIMLTLAEELKGTGVTANILRVNTIDVNHERVKNPTPKNVNWTTPEEIASAVLYLCSEEAGAVNGARIPLHGSPR
jgi:3-oxoacyl-[acyl-carrier protein] reductase